MIECQHDRMIEFNKYYNHTTKAFFGKPIYGK